MNCNIKSELPTNNLFIPIARTSNYALKLIKVIGPKILNTIPNDTKSSLSFTTCNAKVAEREKTRQPVAKCRARKKEVNNTALLIVETYTNEETPKTTKIYDRPQSFRKAVARAKRGLPLSPRKRTEVIKTLAKVENVLAHNINK